MIPPKQPPPNWQEISVIIGGILIVINIVGWFVVHSLTKRREREARGSMNDLAISDFDITVDRWIDAIIDRHQKLPTGWGMKLGGPFDMHVDALEDIRSESLAEIETVMRKVRAYLNDAAKGRLDAEWKKYQDYQIEGRDEKDPATGAEFTNHAECKKGLTDCLEQMKKIAREI